MRLVGKLKNIIAGIKKARRYHQYHKDGNLFEDTCIFGENSKLLRSRFGKYSGCNFNCIINDTWVGNYVNIAWNVTVGLRSHIYTNFTSHDFVYTNHEHAYNGAYFNKIGHDVWIGCNVIILTSVEIGNGAIVAAGSVVTKSVPSYAVVGGNPTKFIKWRFEPEQIKKLERLQWYDWTPEEVIERRRELESIVNFDLAKFKQDYFSRKRDIEVI